MHYYPAANTADKTILAVVSVSGGKDSTATALLALAAYGRDNCRFVFADTGNEHDLTLEYVHHYLPSVLGPVDTVRADFRADILRKREYVETAWADKGIPDEIIHRALGVLYPTGVPFLDLCLWKGRFPSRKAQFCTLELKRRPLDQYLLARLSPELHVESWRGVRREESANRKDTPDRERAAEGFEIVFPIAAWTAQHTVDFVLANGVSLNPLYSQAMSRVGCMPCINCRKDELLEISKRFPEHIDKIREWECLVSLASKRGWTTFFCDSALISTTAIPGWRYSPEVAEDGSPVDQWVEPDSQIYERLRIDSRVRWAQTARGGRQVDFTRLHAPPACSSVYGLCE